VLNRALSSVGCTERDVERPYRMWKRGHVWEYRLAGEKSFHTIGQTAHSKAESSLPELVRSAEGQGDEAGAGTPARAPLALPELIHPPAMW